jgi:hypothetical protein
MISDGLANEIGRVAMRCAKEGHKDLADEIEQAFMKKTHLRFAEYLTGIVEKDFLKEGHP